MNLTFYPTFGSHGTYKIQRSRGRQKMRDGSHPGFFSSSSFPIHTTNNTSMYVYICSYSPSHTAIGSSTSNQDDFSLSFLGKPESGTRNTTGSRMTGREPQYCMTRGREHGGEQHKKNAFVQLPLERGCGCWCHDDWVSFSRGPRVRQLRSLWWKK